jgi:hypothetical protein
VRIDVPILGEVVRRFFEDKGWTVRELEDGSLALTFDGQHGRWRCRMFLDESLGQLSFYSILPELVPADRRAAVVEFVTRANVELILGNFELDLDRGELRFKTSIDVEGDRLTAALLTHVVHANVLSMDRYLPGLARVADPDLSRRWAVYARLPFQGWQPEEHPSIHVAVAGAMLDFRRHRSELLAAQHQLIVFHAQDIGGDYARIMGYKPYKQNPLSQDEIETGTRYFTKKEIRDWQMNVAKPGAHSIDVAIGNAQGIAAASTAVSIAKEENKYTMAD